MNFNKEMQETRITVNQVCKQKDWYKKQQTLLESLRKELRKTLNCIEFIKKINRNN